MATIRTKVIGVDLRAEFFGKSGDGYDAAAAVKQADELRDYHHEMSDVETGRRKRFMVGGDIDPLTGKKRSEADKVSRTLDWLLMNDAAYREAHEGLVSAIREAQDAANTVLDNIAEALVIERAAMDELLSNAAKLPDGTAVFRDKDGNVRRADGSIVDDELAASIVWHDDDPTYEDHQMQAQRIDGLVDAEREVQGIEVDLGEMDAAAHDNNNAHSLDGLKDQTDQVNSFKDKIENIQDRVLKQTPRSEFDHIDAPDVDANSDFSNLSETPIILGGKP